MKNSLTCLPFAKSLNVLFFGKELHFRQSFSQLMVFHKFCIVMTRFMKNRWKFLP